MKKRAKHGDSGSGDRVPARLRQQIDRWAQDWLERTFAPGLEFHSANPGSFNYPVAVFPEWRGKSFYLCARYRTPTRRPDDDFVVRSTRMTLTSSGRFDLAYFRYTERWCTVYRGLTASQCIAEIEADEVFWPMT